MPVKPLKPCNYPGCSGLTRTGNGYCSLHQQFAADQKRARQQDYDRHRGSSTSRGYDAAWQKLRIKVKERDDWLCVCKRCKEMGRIRPVTKSDPVHHIEPVETHPHLRLDINNCESHAYQCHEVEEGRARDHEYAAWKAEKEGVSKSSWPSACRPRGQSHTNFPN